jgi:hypothetical protein
MIYPDIHLSNRFSVLKSQHAAVGGSHYLSQIVIAASPAMQALLSCAAVPQTQQLGDLE